VKTPFLKTSKKQNYKTETLGLLDLQAESSYREWGVKSGAGAILSAGERAEEKVITKWLFKWITPMRACDRTQNSELE
jgi:hypothetical protein